jgi:hypothetical protein
MTVGLDVPAMDALRGLTGPSPLLVPDLRTRVESGSTAERFQLMTILSVIRHESRRDVVGRAWLADVDRTIVCWGGLAMDPVDVACTLVRVVARAESAGPGGRGCVRVPSRVAGVLG